MALKLFSTKMKFKRLIYFILLLNFVTPVIAQDNKKGTGPKEQSVKSERKVRKELRREAKERRRKERAEKKAVKAYHKRLQTKKVRKRMKRSKNTAKLNNENRREGFFRRMFKKKKKV